MGITLLVLLLCSCDREKESEEVPVAPDSNLQTLIDQWLQTDCDFGEDRSLSDFIVRRRKEAIPLLLEAAINGPSDSLSADFIQGVDEMYARIKSRYGAGDSRLFTRTDRRLIAGQARDSFSERRYEAWATAYRSRALVALAELSYDKGRELYEDILADSSLRVLHDAAKQGLRWDDAAERRDGGSE